MATIIITHIMVEIRLLS